MALNFDIGTSGLLDYIDYLDHTDSRNGDGYNASDIFPNRSQIEIFRNNQPGSFQNGKIHYYQKGKADVVVAPFDEKPGGEGLILAKGALAQMDRLIDEMVEDIYQTRSEETGVAH